MYFKTFTWTRNDQVEHEQDRRQRQRQDRDGRPDRRVLDDQPRVDGVHFLLAVIVFVGHILFSFWEWKIEFSRIFWPDSFVYDKTRHSISIQHLWFSQVFYAARSPKKRSRLSRDLKVNVLFLPFHFFAGSNALTSRPCLKNCFGKRSPDCKGGWSGSCGPWTRWWPTWSRRIPIRSAPVSRSTSRCSSGSRGWLPTWPP